MFLASVPTVARSGTYGHVPSTFVRDALCVHHGWHYTNRRPSKRARPEYVLFGHGYWRTWDVPDYLAGGSGEGPWNARNYGYGGGLQMDSTFQRNYGAEFLARYGPAGNWPVPAQLLAAYRGWLRQGWGAWPNTSRACGLR